MSEKERNDIIYCRFSDGEEFTIPLNVHVESNKDGARHKNILEIKTSPMISQKAQYGIQVEKLSVYPLSQEMKEKYKTIELILDCHCRSFLDSQNSGVIIRDLYVGEGVTDVTMMRDPVPSDINHVRVDRVSYLPTTLEEFYINPNEGVALELEVPTDNIKNVFCDDTVVITNLDEILKNTPDVTIQMENEHRELNDLEEPQGTEDERTSNTKHDRNYERKYARSKSNKRN